MRPKEATLQSSILRANLIEALALTVLREAFIDRDPTVVDRHFSKSYEERNPTIPDGPEVIRS